MITHVIWDLGETLTTPPPGRMDVQPLDAYPEIQLRNGVKETLSIVEQLGYVQAILSNTATSDSSVTRRLLERLGVADKFAFIYATQSELTHDKPEKPDPSAFQIVLDAFKIQPEEAVMVGNSWDNDILGANRSGIHGIWLQNPSISVRQDRTTTVQSPPWILPVWDVDDIQDALNLLQATLSGGRTAQKNPC